MPGAQGLSLADECFEPAIILHELMHALGFWHEQSRPDRNKYIEVFWENIKEGETGSKVYILCKGCLMLVARK